MSCEQCFEDSCLRRKRKMTASHMKLCSQNQSYASIFDSIYGIEDEAIIPDSVLIQEKKEEPNQSSKVARKIISSNPVKKIGRKPLLSKSNVTPKKELGDLVESTLSSIGITSERVENWIGRPCGCAERKEKLNSLSRWAKSFWKKKEKGEQVDEEEYKKHLEEMIGG